MKKIRSLLSLLLAAALLSACGTAGVPAETAAPGETAGAAETRESVVVTDVAGLLNALAPGALIEIDADHLALDRAPDYGFGYSDGAYTWEQTATREYALVIRGLEGLTIRGRGQGGTTLDTASTYSDVLRFENCHALTLEDLTFGHRGEVGICAGNVLDFKGCEDVTLRRCDLFGCGVIAVDAFLCVRLFLEDCTLRDCSLAAVNVTCCTDIQARGCEILRCGRDSYLAALCAVSCNGFAMINCRVEGGQNAALIDAQNSSSVCLLGCEATGSRFSDSLFCLGQNITVSGCSLADNEFGSLYGNGAGCAENGSGQQLRSFADFTRMELNPYEGEYFGPLPYVTPSDVPVSPTSAPAPTPVWDGERAEVHASTVDELLAAIAPHTTVFLDGEEFDLSKAADYGTGSGAFYSWAAVYDGYELQLHDLDDFALIGGGMGVTRLSALPRYADVLSFISCRDVSLEGMTIGHVPEPGFCSGDVLAMDSCERMSVTRCGLFGCGEVGLNASSCSGLSMLESNIYDCSYLGASLSMVDNAQFTGCSITNCGGEWGFNGIQLYGCSGVSYEGETLLDGDFLIGQED